MNASNSSNPHPRIAVLGVGTMGGGMARRLLEEGFAVEIWNRNPGPVASLREAGATAHATAAKAVAHVDVMLTMLPTADAVGEVVLRGDVLDALRPGATWAQMGTIGVEATEKMAAEVARRRPDVAFVDAPVSGSREPARTGQLVILASGPDAAQATLEPVFAALGQRTVWLGPAGRGSRMKLVANTLLAFEIEAVAEVDALASRLGLPYADVVNTIGGGPLASAFEMSKLAKMQGGDHSADFSLEWALKDLDLALAVCGADTTPVVMAIAARWRRLVEAGYGRLDVSAARLGLGPGAQHDPGRSGRAQPIDDPGLPPDPVPFGTSNRNLSGSSSNRTGRQTSG
jgi:3-hydroxyisobutyrate dehydrogenase